MSKLLQTPKREIDEKQAATARRRGESYRIDAGAEDAFVARGEAAGRLALLAGGATKAHVIAGPLVSGKQLTPP